MGSLKYHKTEGKRRRVFSSTLLVIFFVLAGCGRDLTDDPIPVVPFAPFTVNLVLPEYQSLALDGGTKVIGSIGVRGVILYRASATSYIAFEKNCSYHPNEAGSTVDVHSSKLYMFCSGCGSNFSFTNGAPTGGVAWQSLRRYRVELSNPNLTITNEAAF